MPASSTCARRSTDVDEGGQVGRQHALAQVAQIDHGDHAVAPACLGRGALEGQHRLELALERDVGQAHRVGGQRRRRRAQQPDGRLDAGVAQPRRVLEARLAERLRATGQQGAPDFGAAAGHLGHADHMQAAERGRDPAGVVGDLVEVDGERRASGHQSPPARNVCRPGRLGGPA